MAEFSKAVGYILKNEIGNTRDGLSDRKEDRGGRTRFGITRATAARHGIDIDDLTMDQAMTIYRKEYWPEWLSRLDSQRVATKILDMAVNFGVATAVMRLQYALIDLGQEIVADGRIGPKTVAAANAVPEYMLLLALCRESARRYAEITDTPDDLTHIRGWIFRAVKLPEKETK